MSNRGSPGRRREQPPSSQQRVIENVEFLERDTSTARRGNHQHGRSSGSVPNVFAPLLSQPQPDTYGYHPSSYGATTSTPYGQYAYPQVQPPQQHQNAPSYHYGAPPPFYGGRGGQANAPPPPPPSSGPGLYNPYTQQFAPYPQQFTHSPRTTATSELSSLVGNGGGNSEVVVDSAALTMDDIEHAFDAALYSQQMHPLKQDGNQQPHPLKRDGSPGRLQNKKQSAAAGAYGSLASPRTPSEANLRGVLLPPPPPPPPATSGSSGTPRRETRASPSHRRVKSTDSPHRPTHRRASSDIPLNKRSFLRQFGGPLRTDPQKTHKRFDVQRNRSFTAGSDPMLPPGSSPRLRSASFSGVSSTGGSGRPPQHRRQSSFSQFSIATDASLMSVVSDIRKSTYFAGYNELGDEQLHFPLSQVHLVMDKSLQIGQFYQVPIEGELFDDYHQTADDISHGFGGGAGGGPACGCVCAQCASCQGKKDLLPPNYYAIAVQDDLYRRVLDEICESKAYPCGLFFCGHHEDVHRPSILLAILVVVTLMSAMGLVAYIVRS